MSFVLAVMSLASITRRVSSFSNSIRTTPVRRLVHSKAEFSVNEEDRFLFDLEGFVVVKNVFSKEEIAAANVAVDKRVNEMNERLGGLRNTKDGTSLAGDGKTGRRDLGGMLAWQAPDRDLFRKVLAHPKLVPYFHEFIGQGYRLDHLPLLISQRFGAEGFHLHGGPLDEMGDPNYFLTYQCNRGKIRSSLMAASVQLTDVKAGDGGFCILRGSHKANFKVPQSFVHGEAPYLDRLYQPVCEAGDVIIFSEATTHGSLAWTAANERRVALYRFAPPNVAYSRSYAPEWADGMYDGLTPAQRAVLEPPYNNRLDRPIILGTKPDAAPGEEPLVVGTQSRSPEKKGFDKQVFKNEYF